MIYYCDAEAHITYINTVVNEEITKKYLAGDKEHGGKLWRKPIMYFMGEEITDLNVYWQTLKVQWEDVLLLVYAAYTNKDCSSEVRDILDKALNVLTMGNREGEEEEELND